MSKTFDLYKAHQEGVSKFDYYMAALCASVLTYTINNPIIQAEENAGNIYSNILLHLSIAMLILAAISAVITIRKNLYISNENYHFARKIEHGSNPSEELHNSRVRKIQDKAIIAALFRDISLIFAMTLIFIARII